MTSLQGALRETAEHRWRGMRSYKRNVNQATMAVATLEEVTGLPDPTIASVTTDHLKSAVRIWLAAGTQRSTCVLRLNCLSAMGVNVRGSRPRIEKTLKWWLKADDEETVVAYCRASGTPTNQVMAQLIRWTTRSGLRIEESLRLRWSDISVDRMARVSVPGLKTVMAQATLVLTDQAVAVLADAASVDDLGCLHVLAWRRRQGKTCIFPIDYWQAQKAWLLIRRVLDLEDPYRATLKALRRSAARSLHAVKGMPLDMVRHYLRHENVQTTMGYLRLTGGYSEEEMSKWV